MTNPLKMLLSLSARSYLALLCGIIALVLLLPFSDIWRPSGRNPTGGSSFQPAYVRDNLPKSQERQKRVWVSVQWSRIGMLSPTDGVMQPSPVAFFVQDELMVLDARDLSLKHINELLKITFTYKLPSEALLKANYPPTDVTSDGNSIWICNPNGHVVRINVQSGRYTVLPVKAYKLGVTDGHLVVMQPAGSEKMFKVIGQDGNTSVEFGTFYMNQTHTGIALDGRLAVDVHGENIYYAPNYNGFMASYDIHGRQRFLMHTIDKEPPPFITSTVTGFQATAQNTKSRIMYLTCYENDIWALVSVRKDRGIWENVLDVYNGESGAYRYSLHMPEPALAIAAKGNTIYAMRPREEGVSAWKVRVSDTSISQGNLH